VPDSPASLTAYEVLGVSASVSDDELRRAYRRLLRETHPDTGGDAARFVAVQQAWEHVGTRASRAAYDRSAGARSMAPETAGASASWTGSAGYPPRRAESSTVRARTYGHPGGQERERYLTLLREWVGRGVEIPDPYDPALLRSAPREIRGWLAKAIAEESTSGIVGSLGIGYTIWNNVLTGRSQDGVPETIDHLVLGPAGLFAIQSEDWGSEVRLHRGELVGDDVHPDEEPLHELHRGARALGRSLGVRFTALVVVVPDVALAEPLLVVDRGRLAGSAVVRRSLLEQLLRNGVTSAERESIDRVFELRTRLQNGIRLA
jgi:curved DNA-binding protein CbpA